MNYYCFEAMICIRIHSKQHKNTMIVVVITAMKIFYLHNKLIADTAFFVILLGAIIKITLIVHQTRKKRLSAVQTKLRSLEREIQNGNFQASAIPIRIRKCR